MGLLSDHSVPYVKGMHRRHHRGWGPLCGAAAAWPHPGDRSKLLDGAARRRLGSAETHKHRSQEETCTQRGDRCDWHSAERRQRSQIHENKLQWSIYSPKHTLTRAVYPAESLRFGSVPLWTKEETRSRSPSIAADQIPAKKNDVQISQDMSWRLEHETVWLWRSFTYRKYIYFSYYIIMNANLVQNPFQSASGKHWERRPDVSSTHTGVCQPPFCSFTRTGRSLTRTWSWTLAVEWRG